MTPAGRPLRFIAALLGGWVVLRAAMLWPGLPGAPRPATLRMPVAVAVQPVPRTMPVAVAVHGPVPPEPTPSLRRQVAAFFTTLPPARSLPRPPGAIGRATLAMFGLIRFGAAQPVPDGAAPQPAVFTPVRQDAAAPASRWSASTWFLARAGVGLGGPYGGQMGGDQAGVRLAYAIGAARRVALVGRIASPLAGVGREAAIGVEWRPTRLPVRLVAEHRFAIDGGGGGPSVGIVGGVGPVPIGGDLRLEGYGQAGIIERHGVIGFGDGAVRVTRQVVRAGRAVLDLGAGAWGGIQPGAERLDIGPSLGLSVPVAGRSLRFALDCGIM